jgi:hydroxymethylpyrimidine/phosphomethylpyrimidine kinase
MQKAQYRNDVDRIADLFMIGAACSISAAIAAQITRLPRQRGR